MYAGSTGFNIWFNDHLLKKMWKKRAKIGNETKTDRLKTSEITCEKGAAVNNSNEDGRILLNLLIRSAKLVDICFFRLDARVQCLFVQTYSHFMRRRARLTWKENLRQDQFHCDCFRCNTNNNPLVFSFILAIQSNPIQLQYAAHNKLNDPQQHNQPHLFRSI